jgi:hypothetical protein
LEVPHPGPARLHRDIHNTSVSEANDTVRHSGDCGVVRDDDRRGPELAVHAFERFEDDHARRDVECAGWLVAKQYGRLLRNGARDGDALLLAAGELRRKVIETLAEPTSGGRPRATWDFRQAR